MTAGGGVSRLGGVVGRMTRTVGNTRDGVLSGPCGRLMRVSGEIGGESKLKEERKAVQGKK